MKNEEAMRKEMEGLKQQMQISSEQFQLCYKKMEEGLTN
jgi:hypothetical protein